MITSVCTVPVQETRSCNSATAACHFPSRSQPVIAAPKVTSLASTPCSESSLSICSESCQYDAFPHALMLAVKLITSAAKYFSWSLCSKHNVISQRLSRSQALMTLLCEITSLSKRRSSTNSKNAKAADHRAALAHAPTTPDRNLTSICKAASSKPERIWIASCQRPCFPSRWTSLVLWRNMAQDGNHRKGLSHSEEQKRRKGGFYQSTVNVKEPWFGNLYNDLPKFILVIRSVNMLLATTHWNEIFMSACSAASVPLALAKQVPQPLELFANFVSIIDITRERSMCSTSPRTAKAPRGVSSKGAVVASQRWPPCLAQVKLQISTKPGWLELVAPPTYAGKKYQVHSSQLRFLETGKWSFLDKTAFKMAITILSLFGKYDSF